MSISSCPQCTKPISLPTGISNTAKVRCPLCRAQYTLADALANVPPLLEVIEEAAPLADASHPDIAEEELSFEAVEIENDDLTMQEQDTEIEDLGFTASDPLVREAPEDTEHLDPAGPGEETVPHFGHDNLVPNEPAHDASDGDEIEIDFNHVASADQPARAMDDEVTIVGIDPAAAESKSEGSESELDFGEALSDQRHDGQETIDFSFGDAALLDEPVKKVEAPLEFGDPIEAESTPVTVADQPPPDEEKGRKKKKKARDKAPAKAGRQGSLVRTLVSLVASSVVILPLALYGMLWISPDYDFFDFGRKLPTWAQPAGLAKSKFGKPIAAAPNPQLAQPAPQETSPAAAEPMPPAEDPAPPPATEPAKTETVEPAPTPGAAPPAASIPDDAPPEPPPADEPAAATEKPKPAQDPAEMPDESVAISADKPDSLTDQSEPAGDEKPAASAASTDDSPGPFDATDDSKDAMPEELPQPAEPAEVVGPRDAARVTLADLAAAMQAAGAANQKFMAAQAASDESAIKKARAQFYMSLYRLAEALTFAEDDPAKEQLEGQRKVLRQILLQFAGDEKRVEAMSVNAALWLGYPKRTVSGIVLAGTVQNVERHGKLYHIKMELASDKKPLSVMALISQDPELKPNDRALVLGSIVENPAQQIAGYEGDEATVVWTGMAVPIPAAQ